MTAAVPTTVATVGQLADWIDRRTEGALAATIVGDPQTGVRAVAPLDQATAADLSFLANVRYRQQALATSAAAIVLSSADAQALFANGRASGVLVTCANPYAWFSLASQYLNPPPPHVPGRDPAARVAADAAIDPTARIDAFAVVDVRARIGANAWIGAGCYVGPDAEVGAGTRLYPGARLLAGCVIGSAGIIHAGAVIGADGFGFAPFAGRYIKIPQTGRVLIGDDVEIGANTTIDRGTMGDTVIEDGVKLDNQVQVAHNVRIGAHTVVAGCVGIAGSAIIGAHCQLGGAAMIHGHISLCDGVVVSGGTLISRSISKPGFYSGVFPFMLNRDWERNAALVRHLDELRARLRKLEAQARIDSGDKNTDNTQQP